MKFGRIWHLASHGDERAQELLEQRRLTHEARTRADVGEAMFKALQEKARKAKEMQS